MRFVAVFFVFCAVAFSQSAPDNNLSQAGKLELLDKLNPPPQDLLKNRVESMKFFNAPRVFTQQPIVVAGKPATCAIPLLNALPAESKVDYKIRIVKPAATERTLAASPQIGIPACK